MRVEEYTTSSGTREPIKVGLLRAMLRKAEIGEDQFLRLLKGER